VSENPPKSHFSQARTALLIADALLRKSAQEKEVPVEVISKLSDQLLQMRLDMRQYLGKK
jgi:hypothetical protein